MPPLSSPPSTMSPSSMRSQMYLKPIGVSQTLAPEFRGNLVDHLGGRKCFRHVAGQIARSGQVPEQNRENLVRSDERAVAVDRADAVGVAIEREARVVAAVDHRAAQRLDVRLDRLRIHAAEKRIARAANFVASRFRGGGKARAAGRAPRRASDRSRNGISTTRSRSQSTSASSVSRYGVRTSSE